MRKLLIGLVAVALLLAGVLMALATPPHCPVSRAASERVEPGMTEEQVHATLGGPPGDYRTGPRLIRIGEVRICFGLFRPLSEFWYGDEGDVIVEYHTARTGGYTVTSVTFEPSAAGRPGPLGLIKWRLGRLKERLLP
jgi:hypothetical protein